MKSFNMLLFDDINEIKEHEKMLNIRPVRSYDVAIKELPETNNISKVEDYINAIEKTAISEKLPSFRRFYWIVKYDITDRAQDYWYHHIVKLKTNSEDLKTISRWCKIPENYNKG
ncbi:uncharacterized protein LOC126551969 [Aphis gossypii]|uniref:uncharacterized protein LOC126551969 n=1 Tax=Aphis gossypii TaxID=80765 RepID=UPI002159618E|nr:uncharacterized protein LOC126551969 [Aphis gossypii]